MHQYWGTHQRQGANSREIKMTSACLMSYESYCTQLYCTGCIVHPNSPPLNVRGCVHFYSMCEDVCVWIAATQESPYDVTFSVPLSLLYNMFDSKVKAQPPQLVLLKIYEVKTVLHSGQCSSNLLVSGEALFSCSPFMCSTHCFFVHSSSRV